MATGPLGRVALGEEAWVCCPAENPRMEISGVAGLCSHWGTSGGVSTRTITLIIKDNCLLSGTEPPSDFSYLKIQDTNVHGF